MALLLQEVERNLVALLVGAREDFERCQPDALRGRLSVIYSRIDHGGEENALCVRLSDCRDLADVQDRLGTAVADLARHKWAKFGPSPAWPPDAPSTSVTPLYLENWFSVSFIVDPDGRDAGIYLSERGTARWATQAEDYLIRQREAAAFRGLAHV